MCDGQVYLLKPVMRVVDNLQVGTVAGTVDPTSSASNAVPSLSRVYPGNVYLFGPVTGTQPGTPDDYNLVWDDIKGGDALTSAMVNKNSFSYTIGFVPAGEYRLAYTCDTDDPEVDANEANLPVDADEAVTFAPADGVAVTVTAGQTATVNFPPQ